VQVRTSFQFVRQREQTGRMDLEGERLRFEQFYGKLVTVRDLDRGQTLLFDMARKQVREVDRAEGSPDRVVNPIDQLRQAKADDATSIGQERLEGRLTNVYRLDRVDLLGIKGDAEMTLWIDVESELPARIVIRDTDPQHPTEFRFEDFTWNEPLDAELFSLEIPEGFTWGEMPVGSIAKDEQRDAEGPAPAVVDGVLKDRAASRIAWDPQGRWFTALMRDPESVAPQNRRLNELRQFDAATGRLRWSQHVQGASEFAATGDGTMLATVIGYEVQLRDATTGDVARTWAAEETLLPLAFSPDGRTLAAGIAEWGKFGGSGGDPSGGVQIWNVEQGTLVRTIVDDEPTTQILYSPDGSVIAASSNGGPVKLWNVATGSLVRLFPGRRADFSPDGSMIACVSTQPAANENVGRVDLYRVDNGELVKTLTSEPGAAASWMLCVRFSADGQLLAAADWNGTVTLWDVASGERLPQIAKHNGGVLTAEFSADGATLATGSEDQTLRLWKTPPVADN
jgi:hypothetical protein